MTNRLLFLSFAAAMAAPFPPEARATEIPELTRELSSAVESSTRAVIEACSSSSSEPEAGDSRWFYRRFWLRMRPKATFAVPGFAKLEISPDVELLWERETPQGWKNYQPPAPAL